MPIGVLLVITLAFMGIKRGLDTPVAAVAMALGDRSDGTILEDPVNMVVNLIDNVWKIAVEVFESRTGGGGNTGALVLHVAQLTGIAA
jgi:hypothetical protein